MPTEPFRPFRVSHRPVRCGLWLPGPPTIVHKNRDAGNHRRPAGHERDRDDHLGQDAAVQPEEDGPFGVLVEVARADLCTCTTTDTVNDSRIRASNSRRSLGRERRRTKYRSRSRLELRRSRKWLLRASRDAARLLRYDWRCATLAWKCSPWWWLSLF